MFKANDIITAFIGLVGFNQNPDPGGVRVVDPSLLASSSGLRFDVQHPLMGLDSLASLAPQFDLFQYGDWAQAEYQTGAIVNNTGKKWKANAVTSQEPTAAATDWDEFDGFTDWLRERVEQGIVQVVNDWLTMKEMNRTAKNLLSRAILFPQNLEVAADTDRAKTVGRILSLPQSESLVADLLAIGVRMEQAETFTLELWRSDRPAAPVNTIEVVTEAADAGGVKWVTLDWMITAGPTWFIAYDQNDLVGRSLSSNDANRYPGGRFLRVAGFEGGIPAGETLGETVATSVGFGLNVKAAVRCDYTEFLIEQRHNFADAVAKGVAVKLLTEYVWNANARTNKHVAGTDKAQVNYDLHGEAMGRASGLRHEYERALKRIAFDDSAIDSVCLPCRSNGVEYGTT